MKSFVQHLHEVGNQPYKWKRIESSETRWKATFETDKNKQKYVFQADMYELSASIRPSLPGKQWHVVFHLFGEGDNSMGVSGTEGTSAIRGFGTVAQIFEAFVKEVKPEVMEFIADKSEGSLRGARSRIYSRFAKRFATKHGYDLKEKNDPHETLFQFSSKKKGKKNK